MRVARRLVAGVEVRRVLGIGDRRIEIAAAAEPRLVRRQEARVHVHCRNVRIGHVGNQADAVIVPLEISQPIG